MTTVTIWRIKGCEMSESFKTLETAKKWVKLCKKNGYKTRIKEN